MPVLITFLLGIGNFALHKAVMESGHPMLDQMRWFFRSGGGKFSLALEFGILLGTLLFAANGYVAAAIAYVLYSMLNSFSAWLILTHKI